MKSGCEPAPYLSYPILSYPVLFYPVLSYPVLPLGPQGPFVYLSSGIRAPTCCWSRRWARSGSQDQQAALFTVAAKWTTQNVCAFWACIMTIWARVGCAIGWGRCGARSGCGHWCGNSQAALLIIATSRTADDVLNLQALHQPGATIC